MKKLQLTVCFVAIVGLVGAVRAQGTKEAPTKERLVGVWKSVQPMGNNTATLDFTKDGKLIINIKAGERSVKIDGTYTLEGNKLKTKLRGPDGQERADTITIRKLTDTQMVTEDSRGNTDTLTKVK